MTLLREYALRALERVAVLTEGTRPALEPAPEPAVEPAPLSPVERQAAWMADMAARVRVERPYATEFAFGPADAEAEDRVLGELADLTDECGTPRGAATRLFTNPERNDH